MFQSPGSCLDPMIAEVMAAAAIDRDGDGSRVLA
jgi:hypothetical protein